MFHICFEIRITTNSENVKLHKSLMCCYKKEIHNYPGHKKKRSGVGGSSVLINLCLHNTCNHQNIFNKNWRLLTNLSSHDKSKCISASNTLKTFLFMANLNIFLSAMINEQHPKIFQPLSAFQHGDRCCQHASIGIEHNC